jgi:ceramide glucosyltransferase
VSPLAAALAALVLASWIYQLVAAAAVRRLFRGAAEEVPAGPYPPVSILKPVRGADPEELERLASFCAQDYPAYEVVFGVAERSDPAVGLIEALRCRHPDVRLRLLVDPPRPRGANRKACLLDALARAADAEVLVAADADMRAGPDHLRRVVSALGRPGVALVTCPYVGAEPRSLWARLEALSMGVGFLPAAVLAARLGVAFAMGATVALRRTDLDRIGGFAALKDYLADDFQLGARVAGPGRRVVLCPVALRSGLGRTTARELWDRELRWSRCARLGRPSGNLGYGVSFTLPLALAFLAVERGAMGAGVLLASLALRFAAAGLVARATGDAEALRALPLLPVRELLSAAVWAAGLVGRRVVWRGEAFRVDRAGVLHPLSTPWPRRPAPANDPLSSARDHVSR